MNKTLGHVRPGKTDVSLRLQALSCSELYLPTAAAQQDFAGTPLRLLGAMASGGKPLFPIEIHWSK